MSQTNLLGMVGVKLYRFYIDNKLTVVDSLKITFSILPKLIFSAEKRK